MGIKLKKEGNSTPSPTWKIGSFDYQTSCNKDSSFPNFNTNKTKSTRVSARKLGAFLWETLPLPRHTPEKKMTRSPIDRPYEKISRESHSDLKREIEVSLIQYHCSVESNSRVLHMVSPASYKSSFEVTSIDNLSPRSLLGPEGKMGNSHFNRKTSNQLALVLNRIWTLEEQHASDIYLVNSLKRELDKSNLQIKKLLLEKDKEQERLKATLIKPLKEELEVERNLRKKLARELLDTKASFVDTLKEYEREKKAKKLLESLCDEFAKGISDLKKKPDRELLSWKSQDKLILRLSEAWLDERKQMKLDDTSGNILDKLSVEIVPFLQEKATKQCLKEDKLSLKKPKKPISIHLMNEAMSTPHKDKDDDNSTSSYSKTPKLKTKKKARSSKKQIKPEEARVNSNSILNSLIKNRILSLEEEKLREDNEVYISKATSKRAHGLKESTLKAKLLEARLKGQH